MYIVNKNFNGNFQSSLGQKNQICSDLIYQAMIDTNKEMLTIQQLTKVDIFSTLGMRNLSSFVGETFVSMMEIVANGLFIKNPHQDGYPDLLLMDNNGINIFKDLQEEMLIRHKEPFSPFKNGGIEVKSTCGTVPSATQLSKKGILKPEIGETRLPLLSSLDWKAHHRETNNLIGIMWDFIDSIPTIVAVFFSSSLTEDHWGNIVQPKKGGGRTTSVSIMNKYGISEMCGNWCILHQDYIPFFNRKKLI